MKVTVDYEKLNKAKELFIELRNQIMDDHVASTGSYLTKEDALTAATVCLLIKAYKLEK